MKEAKADLWTLEADLRVITGLVVINARGGVVMGRGCAREARDSIPGIDVRFAGLIEQHGNRVMRIGRKEGTVIASFPVKAHWKNKALASLILRSARQLVELADKFGYENIVLPRPGCGNGGLSWERVKPLIETILDDRFTVVSK